MVMHTSLECACICTTRQEICRTSYFRYARHDCCRHMERINLLRLSSLQRIRTLDGEMHTNPPHLSHTKKAKETRTLPSPTENPTTYRKYGNTYSTNRE